VEDHNAPIIGYSIACERNNTVPLLRRLSGKRSVYSANAMIAGQGNRIWIQKYSIYFDRGFSKRISITWTKEALNSLP
jgi:hypothetical protein